MGRAAYVALGLALGLGACTHAPPEPTDDLEVQSFDYAWTRIHDTYPDPNFHGVNWDALRDELRPQAEQARNPVELRPVLEDMFSRLGDSHFAVIPSHAAGGTSTAATSVPEGPRDGEIGVDLRLVDGALLLARVDDDSPAAKAGLRSGYVLRGVDGTTVEALLKELSGEDARRAARSIFLARLSGPVGSVVHVQVEDGSGAALDLPVTRTASGAPWIALGSLPATPVHFSSEILPDQVGLIRFDIFMEPVPDRFTAAMQELIAAQVRGVIVDLRGNPGGVAPMAMGMAGHFVSARGQSLGTLQFREATWNLLINPRAACFSGPLAVLVDGLSASTSEIMAAGLQKLGRARIFGENSAGMALPSTWERLPDGDLIQFVTGDYTTIDGVRVERQGVHPDELTPLTRQALLEGRDPAVAAARAWIASSALQGG